MNCRERARAQKNVDVAAKLHAFEAREQWRSQNTAEARPGQGTAWANYVCIVPRPRPAFLRLQYGNAEATREVWGILPQKMLEFLSFLGGF